MIAETVQKHSYYTRCCDCNWCSEIIDNIEDDNHAQKDLQKAHDKEAKGDCTGIVSVFECL